MVLAGCGDGPSVRVYETTRPAAYVWPTTEARTDTHEAGGLTWAWDIPAGFVDAPEVPNQLIADYRFKGTTEQLPGRMTVSMIPGEAGGVMANVMRWRNQLYLTEAKTLGPGDFVSPPFKAGNLELTIVRLTGQYRGPYTPTDLLGAIIRVSSVDGKVVQSWFFKLVGDRETVEANTPLFPGIYTSFRVAGVDVSSLPEELRAKPAPSDPGEDRPTPDDLKPTDNRPSIVRPDGTTPSVIRPNNNKPDDKPTDEGAQP